MKRNKLIMFSLIFAAAICMLDVYLIVTYSENAAAEVGWLKIIGAGAVQIAVFLVCLIWLAMKNSSARASDDIEPLHSYRNYVPAAVFGFALAGLGLSVNLLHIGIVCPTEGLSTSRGHPACSSISH